MKLPWRRAPAVRRELDDAELTAAGEEVLMRIVDEISEAVILEPLPDHDWRSFDEMMGIFEIAPTEDIWRLITCWSASPIPGVRWHCELCRDHAITSTFLQRPTHCGSPMKPEAAQWLVQEMDDRIATISVAFFGAEE